VEAGDWRQWPAAQADLQDALAFADLALIVEIAAAVAQYQWCSSTIEISGT
jgi:hypothetical protein